MGTILKPIYGASSNLTVTALQSLASDTNLLAGWQSDVFDNTSDLFDEVMVTGFFKTAAAGLTANRLIELWVYGILDDSPTYPDVLTAGGQAAKTLTSLEIKLSGALARLGSITINATASQTYPFQFLLAQNGFGLVPKKYGFFVTQSSGAALAATGQQITRIGYQWQNV